ncbi:MAG: hypothetical protein ABIJ45_11545 [Candidatus Zixiibacteriota bacterium]
MHYKIRFILLVCFIFCLALAGLADDKSGEQINWQVISSGGSIGGSSTNFVLSGTIGQTAVASGTSTNFGLLHGFWQDFGSSGAVVNCGDANNNAVLNILDITYLIAYLYKSGPAPIPYNCVGDPNGSANVNILDITYLIAYLYKSGPPPVTDCCQPIW